MTISAAQAALHESAYFPGFTLADVRGTWVGQRSPFKVLGAVAGTVCSEGLLESSRWLDTRELSPSSGSQGVSEPHE